MSSRPVPLAAVRVLLAAVLLAAAPPPDAGAQIPSEFENLRVLPEDIPRDSLVQLMRSFSFATGLRCSGCHVMGEGGSFQGAQFHLDDKPEKRQARYMLEMVDRLNEEILPGLPERDQPALRVECKTCHRGIRKPFLLRTELHRVIREEGVEAAEARYRELREHAMEDGTYDFGVWETMELARELEVRGNDEAAAAMLELNEEFHPWTAAIPRTLAPIYERLGRTEDAIAAYARAVGLNPNDTGSFERLAALVAEGSP